MLITMWKSPKVKKIAGKEMKFIIGFTNEFMKPKTIPPRSKLVQVGSIMNPGMSLEAIKMASELAKIRTISFINPHTNYNKEYLSKKCELITFSPDMPNWCGGKTFISLA